MKYGLALTMLIGGLLVLPAQPRNDDCPAALEECRERLAHIQRQNEELVAQVERLRRSPRVQSRVSSAKDRIDAAKGLLAACNVKRVDGAEYLGFSWTEIDGYLEMMRRDIAKTGSLRGRYTIQLTPAQSSTDVLAYYLRLSHADLQICLDELMDYARRYPSRPEIDGKEATFSDVARLATKTGE